MRYWPLVLLALACLATTAAAATTQTLTRDGSLVQGSAGSFPPPRSIELVNDGSFENGECDAGSSWACTTNAPGCSSWILDPMPIWGYPAYDGLLCAWLGGFCGTPNSNSFCQDVYIPYGSQELDWCWMGYVNDACGTAYLTIDGVVEWSHTMLMSEDTYGTWNYASAYGWSVWVNYYQFTTISLCFEWVACPDGESNDNMLVDYVMLSVVIDDPCPAADAAFSTVKARY